MCAGQVDQNLTPIPVPWIFNILRIRFSTDSKGFCQVSFGEWDMVFSMAWKNEVERCHREQGIRLSIMPT